VGELCVCVWFSVGGLFFVKRKAEYEVGRGDGGSDGCSSDLEMKKKKKRESKHKKVQNPPWFVTQNGGPPPRG